MELSINILILVGIVVVLLGLVAMGLLNSMGGEAEVENEGADQDPPKGLKGRYTSLLRLWREQGTDRLVVDMQGKALVTNETLTPAQREQLVKAWRDLGAWLDVQPQAAGVQAVQPVEPPAKAAVQPAAAQPVAAQPTVIQPAAAQMPASAAPQVVTTTPASPPLHAAAVSAVPSSAVGHAGLPVQGDPLAIPPAVRASKSIAMQIEDILQEILVGTPLEQRHIHVLDDPKRGVIVKVGLDSFEGIDAVRDPEVKAVLRQAVATWERSQ